MTQTFDIAIFLDGSKMGLAKNYQDRSWRFVNKPSEWRPKIERMYHLDRNTVIHVGRKPPEGKPLEMHERFQDFAARRNK